MRNIYLVAKYTFREAISRKIFLAFTGISTFVLLLLFILFVTLGIEDFFPMVKVNGEEINVVEKLVTMFRAIVIVPLYGGGIFLSIFASASFIPNLLEKGNIDLFLSKPVARPQIMLGQFLGGLFIVLLNIAYLVFGIYFLLGFKFNAWDSMILITIPTITFTFAALYAFIMYIGVISRSSVLAMMITYLIFFILSPLLANRQELFLVIDNSFVQGIITTLYYIIPKTTELGKIVVELTDGKMIADWQPVFTTLGFMILSLGATIFTFDKKDF